MPSYLSELFGNISQQLSMHLPRFAGAALILLAGWVIAHLVSRVIQYSVSKAGIGNQLAIRFGLTARRGTISAISGKLAFYLVMVFVLVAFFNTLSLPVVSEPLNAFLKQIFEFAPRLLSAIAIGFIAWVLARAAKEGSCRGLEAINVDEWIGAIGKGATTRTATEISQDETSDVVIGEAHVRNRSNRSDETIRLSKTLPEAAYWLVLFMFLPAILGTLELNGLLEPIQSMCNKAMNYVPNVLGAAFLLVAGAMVARIVRRVVSNLSVSLGANRLASRIRIGDKIGNRNLSDVAGGIAYAMVFVPIIVAALNTLDIDAVTQPASRVLGKILDLVPGVLGALAVTGVSYFIGKVVSEVVSDLLANIGFNELPSKLGIVSRTAFSQTPSNVAGKGVFALIMLFATMQALPMMGLDLLAEHLKDFIAFVLQVMLGSTIIAVGVYLSRIASEVIRASGITHAPRFATISQVAIILFAGAAGLQRMGMAPFIVNVAFTTFFGGLGLAAAIAFGWGGRDAAKKFVDRFIS